MGNSATTNVDAISVFCQAMLLFLSFRSLNTVGKLGISNPSPRYRVKRLTSGQSRDTRRSTVRCIDNVPPCVARNPPCRNKSTVQVSQVSPSRDYEVMANVSIVLQPFLCKKPMCSKKDTAVLIIMSIVLFPSSIATLSVRPCSITTISVFPNFGAMI